MELQFIIISALIGFAAGISAGFWGVGGGWLIVPALLLLGVDTKIAVTASLLQMLASSSFTVLRQVGKIGWGKESWGMAVALPLCGLSFIGGFFGKPLGNYIEHVSGSRTPHQALYMILLFYIFYNIIFCKSGGKGAGPEATATLETARSKMPVTAIAGFFTGALSSLLGIGGGTVTRPLLRNFLKLPENVTGQIGRLSVFIVALSGSASYLSGLSAWNYSDPVVKSIMIGAVLASGGMIGFAIGARMHAIVLMADKDTLAHKSFAFIVLFVLLSMGCKLTGFLKAGQMILTVSGIALTFYLIALTVVSGASIKKRLESNEDKNKEI
jgi:uncharacterized membrane protein YfcA